MAVEIETYLRSPDGVFTRIEDCGTPPPDLDYVEGAIRISVDGCDIIGLAEWDDVNWLWPYIATMTADLADSDHVATPFPSQPIGLSFSKKGTSLEVAVDYEATRVTYVNGLPKAEVTGRVHRRGLAPAREFLTALQAAGRCYFAEMSRLAPAAFNDINDDLPGLTGVLNQD